MPISHTSGGYEYSKYPPEHNTQRQRRLQTKAGKNSKASGDGPNSKASRDGSKAKKTSSPTTPPTAIQSSSPTAIPTSNPMAELPICTRELVPSPIPNCPDGFLCLQNEAFGIDDPRLFNMDLSLEINSTLDSGEYRAAYTEARCIWMKVITGDLPPESAIPPGQRGNCANTLPSLVDDLHICGRDILIDGPSRILGQASPRFSRQDPATGKVTTVTGQME